MRILTVVHDLGLGGTQRAAQVFAMCYQRLGHTSAILAINRGGVREPPLRANGIPVFEGTNDVKKCGELADGFDPQIVHIHRFGRASELETHLLARLRTGKRRVLETNVFGRVDYSTGADFVDVHFQLSKWSMWKWRKCLGTSGYRKAGVVIPNPVDTSTFPQPNRQAVAAYRESLEIPANAFVCGRVGQPHPSKWHPDNLRAFRDLASDVPDAYLVLVGMPENLRPIVSTFAANVRNRIRIIPPSYGDHQLSVIYSAMECFLHASEIGESFGYVLAEAMLCGCPVVTASRPDRDNSQLEVVGHLEGGLCAASTGQLGVALRTLWLDNSLREQIRKTARSRVIRKFDAMMVARKAVKVAEIALETSGREQLIERLDRESDFETRTTDDEIRTLLEKTIGNPSPAALFRMRLVHIPSIQKGVQKFRRWQTR